MNNILVQLSQGGLINPPLFLVKDIDLLVQSGSIAQNAQTTGDEDYTGFVTPPQAIVLPHTRGVIFDFDTNFDKFNQWVQHHVEYNSTVYDFNVYSIIKLFNLIVSGNPHATELIYTEPSHIKICSSVGTIVLNNKQKFLSQAVCDNFLKYAVSQYKKIVARKSAANPQRNALIKDFGYDTKFAKHALRLLLVAQALLKHSTTNIDAHVQLLEEIRNGHYSFSNFTTIFDRECYNTQCLLNSSVLEPTCDFFAVKKVLVECLEEKYGCELKTFNLFKLGEQL